MKRRKVLQNLSALGSLAAFPEFSSGISRQPAVAPVRKIATEEAFTIPEIADAYREWINKEGVNLDRLVLKQIYDTPDARLAASNTDVSNRDRAALGMLPKLLDLDAIRLSDMEAGGVSMHILSLTMPGVQVFEPRQASALARLANDRLAEAIRKQPARYAGLACFAPHDPQVAAKEMERGIQSLGLNGFIVNSHTHNLYLDDPSFSPVLEAAEALNAPLYIHPRAVSDGMAKPFQDYRMEGAAWGYGIETSTHILRLIFGGVLDRFPKLQIVIGHMGEGLPFWLWRLDFMGSPGARAGRKNQLKPSEYFKRNIFITTSGVEDPVALRFCIDKLGADRIMWAIDYPYQPTAPAVAFIETAPLSDVEREMIAFRNAERIFRISR